MPNTTTTVTDTVDSSPEPAQSSHSPQPAHAPRNQQPTQSPHSLRPAHTSHSQQPAHPPHGRQSLHSAHAVHPTHPDQPSQAGAAGLRRRLGVLQVAVFLQAVGFWVPIEKLFMVEIGFDAATIGVMVAAYAALVPLVEVVSGVLADRWSRRGVLVLAGTAMLVATAVGGLSYHVITYIVAALILGIYFGMYSGTLEAIVYDTVLEETGSSSEYERQLGRIRLIESTALVLSALAGGWLASVTSTRLTYFVTLPFVLASLIVLLRFREPRLHQSAERTSMGEHLRVTLRAILYRGRLLPIAAAAIMSALILQAMFEFGPLWLITLAASAAFYGPYWAGLVSTLGLGGLLAGRLRLHRPVPVAVLVVVMLLACLTMTTSRNLAALTVAMIVLTLLVVVAGIHVSRLMHDAVPSTIRTGVASGISAVSWIVFLPFALGFGAVSKQSGVYVSGWMITAAAVLAGAALVWVVVRPVEAVDSVEAAGDGAL